MREEQPYSILYLHHCAHILAAITTPALTASRLHGHLFSTSLQRPWAVLRMSSTGKHFHCPATSTSRTYNMSLSGACTTILNGNITPAIAQSRQICTGRMTCCSMATISASVRLIFFRILISRYTCWYTTDCQTPR